MKYFREIGRNDTYEGYWLENITNGDYQIFKAKVTPFETEDCVKREVKFDEINQHGFWGEYQCHEMFFDSKDEAVDEYLKIKQRCKRKALESISELNEILSISNEDTLKRIYAGKKETK